MLSGSINWLSDASKEGLQHSDTRLSIAAPCPPRRTLIGETIRFQPLKLLSCRRQLTFEVFGIMNTSPSDDSLTAYAFLQWSA